ncbi:hypothetical protein E2320_004794 [Naja naja]|nr:hypothetical protein E2320_004794 [Naja naja]
MANPNEDVSDTQCIEACRECEEDELFADLTLPTDSQWGAYNWGYGEKPLQGYQEREQEECEEDELFADLTLPTDSQWAAYNCGCGEMPLQGYRERELEEWWNGLMQDKFPRCSTVQSVQMGGNHQASTSKSLGADYPSEIEQPLPATHDSEELELQDRDSDQFSAEVPRLTDPQGVQQSIETNEGPTCCEWDVQGEDTAEPQPSTSNGIQEPACKKPKRGDEEPPTTDTWNGSVSNELDMSETQTADESVPSEDFDGLNTPEEPSVYLESVQAWQRNLQHYRATEYYERYRFVNMEYVQSFTRAIDIIHNEVQRLLNRISGEISPNDFVQLRLDAEELDNGMSTKEEIITRAMSLHNTLGLFTARRVDFSQIHLFEDHFGITIKIVYIVYDFECCQETGTHIPNYVYAMDMLEDGAVRRWEWYGENRLEEFVKTFVQPKFKIF